jgi:hypothetical protein
MSNIKSSIHKFEQVGLGVAPFRCVAVYSKYYQASPDAPRQVGGSCDYCGTGIVQHCEILSADGRTFVVGNECVRHTYDKALISETQVKVNAVKREARHERENARIAAAMDKLTDVRVQFALKARPHSNAYHANKGLTMLDSVEWFFQNAGNKGKIEAARIVEAIDADSVDIEAAVLAIAERDAARELAETEKKNAEIAEREADKARREGFKERNADILAILNRKPSGGFIDSMINALETGDLWELSDRQFSIVCDIYAKEFGRSNSRAYNGAALKLSERRFDQQTERANAGLKWK